MVLNLISSCFMRMGYYAQLTKVYTESMHDGNFLLLRPYHGEHDSVLLWNM
jgi:hypothetical protein